MMQQETRTTELVLNPGSQAFVQDTTSGKVQTHVGPTVVTQQGNSRPIIRRDGKFENCSLTNAATPVASADKGEYLILHNPTVEGIGLKHPEENSANAMVPELRYGEKIVVPGPVQFALWPEQDVELVEGHQLRKDQYLVAKVYDEEAAVENWGDAVVQGGDDDEVTSKTAEELGLTLGQLLIIKGVNFFIPSTGIEVLPDQSGYVRDALTLEMSEFCILVDQSGNKRYEKGPAIVFPEPTEEFFEEGGSTKFKPTELTPNCGLYIKVNCDHVDTEWPGDVDNPAAGPREFGEGEEVFITGERFPIYYPREVHSVIRQGDDPVRYATAVPSGQGRYVMNKATGDVVTRLGPDMILPNPVNEVFVTRVLSDNEVLLMYPGNMDALDYNRSLRQFQVDSGSTGEALLASASADYASFEEQSMRGTRSFSAKTALPDQISRKTSYTKPHSVTLDDNRFQGVPNLKIWTGYAVELVKADGTRRTEVGPKTVMLDYDETVQPMHLSTGKPKNTDKLITTGYLLVSNNKISDIIEVETSDGVVVKIKVSYLVSFEGDKGKWFAVDNYVKFGCDRGRSILKGVVRKSGIREFYANSTEIVRDAILGKNDGEGRPGLEFEENGMIIKDVEVLAVVIDDDRIADLLAAQQQEVITSKIEVDRSRLSFEVEQAKEEMQRKTLEAQEETRELKHQLRLNSAEDSAQFEAVQATQSLKRAEETLELTTKEEETSQVEHEAEVSRKRTLNDLDIAFTQAKTDQVVKRFQAAEGPLAEAIVKLGDDQVAETLAKAMGPMGFIGQTNLGEIIEGFVGDNELTRRLAARRSNGK